MRRWLSAPIVAAFAASVLAQGQTFPQPAPPRQVTVTAIPGVVAAGATWTLAWQGTDNADGIIGTPDGGVLFAQEQPSRVTRLDRRDKAAAFVEQTHGAGALAFDANGRLLAVERTCTDPGLRAPCSEPTAVAVLYPSRDRRTLADNLDGKPLGRLNDLVVGRRGDVYFTVTGLFHLSRDGKVTAIGEHLRTNGVMLSPDEKTLYVTNGAAIEAFDVQASGSATNQRVFATLAAGGNGDGMAIDADGRVYVTSQPGVQVFDATGRYLGVIPTPRPVISVAFSGPRKRTLYVVGSGAQTADGKEFTTPPGVRNNAKSIYRLPVLARGFRRRAK